MPGINGLETISFNFSDQQRVDNVRKEMMLQEIEEIHQKAKAQGDSINEVIKKSPYYELLSDYWKPKFLVSFEEEQYVETFNIHMLEEYYNKLLSYKGNYFGCDDALEPIKRYLRHNYREKYVETFFKEHPDSVILYKEWWQEYKCNYYLQHIFEFVIAHQEGKVDPSLSNCRKYAWDTYGKYYDSREEFDVDYNEGVAKLQERRSLYEHLETQLYYFQKNLIEANKIKNINLQGAQNNNDRDGIIPDIVSLYNSLNNYPIFREKAINIILEENERAKKEYEKNGYLFTTKVEFITAYFDPEYKKILKSKK